MILCWTYRLSTANSGLLVWIQFTHRRNKKNQHLVQSSLLTRAKDSFHPPLLATKLSGLPWLCFLNCFLTSLLGGVYKLLRLQISSIIIYCAQVSPKTFKPSLYLPMYHRRLQFIPLWFNVSSAFLYDIISLKPFFRFGHPQLLWSVTTVLLVLHSTQNFMLQLNYKVAK